jgi:hypothetical protein
MIRKQLMPNSEHFVELLYSGGIEQLAPRVDKFQQALSPLLPLVMLMNTLLIPHLLLKNTVAYCIQKLSVQPETFKLEETGFEYPNQRALSTATFPRPLSSSQWCDH